MVYKLALVLKLEESHPGNVIIEKLVGSLRAVFLTKRKKEIYHKNVCDDSESCVHVMYFVKLFQSLVACDEFFISEPQIFLRV